ncbi:MAG: hypothetical protein ACTSYI_07995 [Promethearchaeota archaeon]
MNLIKFGGIDLNYAKKHLKKSSSYSKGYYLFVEGITARKFTTKLEQNKEYAEALMDYYGQDPLTDEQILAADRQWDNYMSRTKSVHHDIGTWDGHYVNGLLYVTHVNEEIADQVDMNLHNPDWDPSIAAALGVLPIDYYIATHNRDGIGLLDNAISYQGKCTVNMYNYYMATIAKISRSERSFGHTVPFMDLASETLTRILKNPNIIENQDRFRHLYESMGVEFSSDAEVTAIHSAYLSAIHAYVNHIKTLSPAQFDEGLLNHITAYLDCLVGIPASVEQELREGFESIGIHAQIQAGVNPMNPSDLVWTYQKEVYDPSDYEPVFDMQYGGYVIPLMQLKPGATPHIVTMVVDRRLGLLARDPNHEFDTTDPNYQAVANYLERYRIYAIGRMKQMIRDVNKRMRTRASKTNGLTNLPADVNLFPDNYEFPESLDGVYEDIDHIWNSKKMEFYTEGNTPKIPDTEDHYPAFNVPTYQEYWTLVEQWEVLHPGQGGTSAPWFSEMTDWNINPVWIDVEL